MHCASHGEFEQGRPLLEALQNRCSSIKIVVTFFSPSGMQHSSWADITDEAYYLPADTPRNARMFLDLIKPDLAVFVKYELWYHFLHALHQRKIPAILIAANFHSKQIFFRWYGGLFRKMLSFFNLIMVQYRESGALLDRIGIHHYEVCGDPRFERAIKHAQKIFHDAVVDAFRDGKNLLVAGSTWPEDEAMLIKVFSSSELVHWRLLLVPHEIDRKRIRQFQKKLPGTLLYSSCEISQCRAKDAKVMIVDRMGLLASLYRYGTAAYVGGALGGTGLHNILEPAVYGLPLIFGPKYNGFPEAKEMIDEGIAAVVKTPDQMASAMKALERKEKQREIALKAGQVFERNQGVVHRMMSALQSRGIMEIKKPTS